MGYNRGMKSQATKNRNYQPGLVHWSTIIVIVLSVLFAGAGAFGIWAYLQYTNARSDVDGQIEVAVSAAEKEQAEKLHNEFLEEEKKPNYTFTGPEDYGSVSFSYPKTWSVYEAKNQTNDKSTYEAYFNPRIVPPVSPKEQFALRMTIESTAYGNVVDRYAKLVKQGKLKSSTFSSQGVNGTRLDGNFSNDIRGSAIVIKIRDKTLTLRTDSDTFKSDFDSLISTLDFVQ